MEFSHIPVMLTEAIDGLAIKPDGVYIDGTAGGAGHSRVIASALTSGRLFALDKDPDAIATASERLAGLPAEVYQRDFADIPLLLDELGIPAVDGILLDLGVSSHQLDAAERGFSYMKEAPLDMRMAQSGISAADIVNNSDVSSLARILREFGEERYALAIAKKINRARQLAPVETTAQLADIVRQAIPPAARAEGGHPAKRTFQALRIAVNGELDSLSRCLEGAFDRLAPGGRFCVITFHSLEDRIVKQAFASFCRGCTCPPDFPICVCGKKPRARLISRKPIEPSPTEQENNPRSKSAKLRVLEKL